MVKVKNVSHILYPVTDVAAYFGPSSTEHRRSNEFWRPMLILDAVQSPSELGTWTRSRRRTARDFATHLC